MVLSRNKLKSNQKNNNEIQGQQSPIGLTTRLPFGNIKAQICQTWHFLKLFVRHEMF